MKENILQKILYRKKLWLTRQKKKQPLHTIKHKICSSQRNFYNALKKDTPSFILECKKYSPSKGLLNSNFNINNIALIYKKYASVISVITDEDYFQGNFEYLLQFSTLVHQPLLCKDFFIDPYQIYLARYYQADAILLMLSVLTDNQYTLLSNIAKELNMGVLTEVNNFSELNRAIALQSNIIGINNRNLNNLTIDMNTTKILAEKIPKKIIVISESGFSKYTQIRQFSNIVQGFLIGTTLMLSNNLEKAICKLIMGENKICGLTRLEDAIQSDYYGAIYGGLIFCPQSLRKININIALKIIQCNKLKYIGVFYNEDIKKINKIINVLSLYGVQLHGTENQEYIDQLSQCIPKTTKIWKALHIHNMIPNYNWKHINKYILDHKNGGGSNKTFNWSLLNKKNTKNILLAGGVNEINCLQASKLGCDGLDLNSGVEISPGLKDINKIKTIFKILRYYQ
ncbi:MAG: bifunctional indole-3-glycerol-phosphate synthase TrpC/phosphoribosylanthranilate isomerase TrpF [Buchnera aphidicola (Eriosoma harunire)]